MADREDERIEDLVSAYAKGLNWEISHCNVLVEGETDRRLLTMAGRLHREETGEELFGESLAIICSGYGAAGGTRGVVRELTVTRALSAQVLDGRGRQKYRFVGLVDNDRAGRQAIKGARAADASVREYRDIFRLRPRLARSGSTDAGALERTFERLNERYRQLEWEIEDLVASDFVDAFVGENPLALKRKDMAGDQVHREWTTDGKRELHRFIREHALVGDLAGVVELVRSLRFCLGVAN